MVKKQKAAIIFDFDGLILDTETPEMFAWQQAYAEVGLLFDLDAYLKTIGSFNPQEKELGVPLARHLNDGASIDEIYRRVRQGMMERIEANTALPGVEDVLTAAEQRGIRLAIGSSSPEVWVAGHLKRLGLYERFDAVVTFDDTRVAKPSPAIFLLALERLGVRAGEALVLEDSYNGIIAANAAGIRAVAVPNLVTKDQDFSTAAEVLASLADLDIDRYFPMAASVKA